MIHYLLSVSICWLSFYLVYLLFLEKETFFSSNRYYLLLSLIGGLCIPTLHFVPVHITDEPVLIADAAQLITEGSGVVTYYFHSDESSSFDWSLIILLSYFLGVLLALAKTINGLNNIYRIHKSGIHKRTAGGLKLVSSRDVDLPFSFFSYVYVSPTFLEDPGFKEILAHESVHIEAHHTLDILFLELLAILFWWNPMIYLYRRAIKQTHEYLADNYASKHIDKKNYGHILLGQGSSGMELALTNQFFNSHLKKRIDMLFKEKSASYKRSRYLLLIPILVVMGLLFSCTTDSNSDEEVPEKLVEIMDDLFNRIEIIPEDLGVKDYLKILRASRMLALDCPDPSNCNPDLDPSLGVQYNFTALMKNQDFVNHRDFITERFIKEGMKKNEAWSFQNLEDGSYSFSSRIVEKEDATNTKTVPKALVQIMDDLLSDDFIINPIWDLQNIDTKLLFTNELSPGAGFLNNYSNLMKIEKYNKYKEYIENRFAKAAASRGKNILFSPNEYGKYCLSTSDLGSEVDLNIPRPVLTPTSKKSVKEFVNTVLENGGYNKTSSILFLFNDKIITKSELYELEVSRPWSVCMSSVECAEVKDKYPKNFKDKFEAVMLIEN